MYLLFHFYFYCIFEFHLVFPHLRLFFQLLIFINNLIVPQIFVNNKEHITNCVFMEEAEEQLEEIDVDTEVQVQKQDVGIWSKKLCGLTWRIDVPVNSTETDGETELEQPHAVVELVFSSQDSSGKEVC